MRLFLIKVKDADFFVNHHPANFSVLCNIIFQYRKPPAA